MLFSVMSSSILMVMNARPVSCEDTMSTASEAANALDGNNAGHSPEMKITNAMYSSLHAM